MTQIKAMIAGQTLALCAQHGAAYVAQGQAAIDLPNAETDAAAVVVAEVSADLRVERGERFAISRGLAVVPVRGVLTPNSQILERWLGWSTYDGIIDTMMQLDANEDVRGIVMDFDTPGGMVLRCSAAAEAIARVSKPVHALVNPMAASAGYWLAAQCNDITMTAGSLVGSIGVMGGSRDPVQPGMSGYLETIIRSSHARAKNADASTDMGRALLQQYLDEHEARFHAAVAEGRGLDLETLPELLSVTGDARDGGAPYEEEAALMRDLVDVIGADRNAFYARMAELYAPAATPARRGRGAQLQAAAAQARAAI